MQRYYYFYHPPNFGTPNVHENIQTPKDLFLRLQKYVKDNELDGIVHRYPQFTIKKIKECFVEYYYIVIYIIYNIYNYNIE